MMRIKFYKRPPPIPPNFNYRSGEVTKVMKITPKTQKSADQRNNLIPGYRRQFLTFWPPPHHIPPPCQTASFWRELLPVGSATRAVLDTRTPALCRYRSVSSQRKPRSGPDWLSPSDVGGHTSWHTICNPSKRPSPGIDINIDSVTFL